MNNFLLEVCTDSVESSLTAMHSGADRLELCSNLVIGGTTPGVCLFEAVRKHCDIRLHVLIRPRFGDFCYSDYESDMMLEEVKLFRKLGADGIVVGILNQDGTLNTKQMEKVVNLADGIPVTLHRAFDVCADPLRTLEEARKIGIRTILTSGQKRKCIEGTDLIKELILKSRGEIDILVGGGVSAGVIQNVHALTKATSYHMSGKRIEESSMIYRKKDVPMGLPSLDEYQLIRADGNEIRRAADLLKKLGCS